MRFSKLCTLAELFMLAVVLFWVTFSFIQPRWIEAGVYDAETGTVYKEVWIDHDEFTGGCGSHERPNGSWYIEPPRKGNADCQKILEFELPADFANASKIEIFMDIWRGDIPPNVHFALNDGPTHATDVGLPWSRTPFTKIIDSSEFVNGTNRLQIWNTNTAYHMHDAAFRLHYDPGTPLAGQTAPNAQLLTVTAANGTFAPNAGGVLNIDNDQLILTAGNVSANTEFIEFHAYYDGYDEDNDGETIDWHNRTRNNCHPGGFGNYCSVDDGNTTVNPAPSGTTDHVGTVRTDSSQLYTVTWQIPHIPGQSGVKFKVRAISYDRNVRDAAGGVSAPFTLNRTKAVTTFSIPGFEDAILHGGGNKPLEATYQIELPPDVQSYDQAYIIGSYWKNPYIKINQLSRFRAFGNGDDTWALAMRTFDVAGLEPGQNTITYEYGGGYGQFIEKPGPMIVLRRTSAPGADTTSPWIYHVSPAGGSIYVDPDSAIKFSLYDSNTGVDESSIVVKVNGTVVAPTITGDKYDYKLHYQPPTPFAPGSTVTVRVEAADHAQNAMQPETFSFAIEPTAQPADFSSDDFNSCTLDMERWTFVNPRGDATLTLNGTTAVIDIPSGQSHDIWAGRKDSPRLVQNIVDGNFDVIVKFDSVFMAGQDTQIQGLLVGNSSDFIRFNVQFDGTDTILFLRNFQNGTAIAENGTKQTLSGQSDPPAYLRITRTDPNWTFAYSDNGNNWTTLAEFSRIFTVSELSIFGGNAANDPAHTVIVDYIFSANRPISPEDGNAVELPVNIVGQGTVTNNPDCGNPTTLTATASPGWRFSHYDGTLSSSNNPATFAFDKNDQVTAHFVPEYYTLAVARRTEAGQPIADELVTVQAPADPQGYRYDEEVQLNATDNVAWAFVRWQGAVESIQPTTTLTMTSNQVVTATFAPQHYALDLTVVDGQNQAITTGGAVTVAPQPAANGYVYGTAVDLTATTEPGWLFQGWQGDLDGIEAQQRITIDGAKQITATFQQLHYPLTLFVVDPQGEPLPTGEFVTVTAPAESQGYIHGETATLTATTPPGWIFHGWGGDLGGTVETQPLAFDGPKTVLATFEQRYYPLTLLVTDEQGQPLDSNEFVTVTRPTNVLGYTHNESATFAALEVPGWEFVSWGGDLSGNERNEIVAFDAAKYVTATFMQSRYTVTVQAINQQGIAADAATFTITPPADPMGYRYGEEITVTVTPKAGWNFVEWKGAVATTTPTVSTTITENITLNALLVPVTHELSLRHAPLGAGALTATPTGTYTHGQAITVTAIPSVGWQFSGWQGDLAGAQNPATLLMDANKTITATFTPLRYQVAVAVGGQSTGGTVSITPDQESYGYGEEIRLVAEPFAGWQFDGWTITPSPNEERPSGTPTASIDLANPDIKFKVTDDLTVTAAFIPVERNRIYLPLIITTEQ